MATFLQEVALMCRPKAPLLTEAQYPRLVGAHVNKHVGTVVHVGRVTGFDSKSCSFELEYRLPGSMSLSQNEIEEVSFDVLKNVLVLMPGNAFCAQKSGARGRYRMSACARHIHEHSFVTLFYEMSSSIEIL